MSGRRFWFVVAGLLALAQPAASLGASSRAPETFTDLIAGMQLVVVADVAGEPDTGLTFSVETFLKGTGAPVVRCGPDAQSAVQPGWTRVVIAFAHPATDDFRAPTIAWHIAPDGTIDPEGYQPYVGLPRTLAAMLSYFAVTAPSAAVTATSTGPGTTAVSSAAAVATPDPAASADEPSGPLPGATLLVVAIAGTAIAGWLLRRPRGSR